MYQQSDQPLYLVIPLEGISEYEKFETLFSFYQDGIHGVVRDYLKIFADPEFRKSLEVDDLEHIPCSAGGFAPEQELLETIMKQYENSYDYMSQLNNYPNCQMEMVVELVCEMIGRQVQEVVDTHHDYFTQFQCEFDKPKWLGTAMAVKAVRIPTYH